MASKTNRGVFVRLPDDIKNEIDVFAQRMDISITAFASMMTIIGVEHWKKVMDTSDTDLKTIAQILIDR